jgi:hypothetical protein
MDQQHPCYKAISLVNNIICAKMFELKNSMPKQYIYIYINHSADVCQIQWGTRGDTQLSIFEATNVVMKY